MKMVVLNHAAIALVLCCFAFMPSLHGIIFNPIDHINKQNLQVIQSITDLFTSKNRSKKISFDLFLNNQSSANNQEKTPSVITFKDIAGIDEILDEIKTVVSYIKEKEKYLALGAKPPRGILLHGAPGTGKTLIAQAIAHEAGCNFFYESGSSFIEKYVGVGAQRIRDLFAKAAAQQPAIIFIDEIDAIAQKRSESSQEERRQTLNQLLCLMDGFNQNNSIIVLAATNCPESLDLAALRSGRFDRVINIPLPNTKSRQEILELYIKKLPSVQIDASFIENLAQKTQGLSGADLNNLVNQATFIGAKENATVITQEHFTKCFHNMLKQRKNHLF